MKIYLLETNANNSLLLVEGNQAKILWPEHGCIDGVDLYADDAIDQLRSTYNTDTVDTFDSIEGGVPVSLSDIDTDRDIEPDRLTLVYDDDEEKEINKMLKKYKTGWDEVDFAELVKKFKSGEDITESEWREAWKYAISTMNYDELEAAGLDYETIRSENICDDDMLKTLTNMAENYEGQFEI